MARYFDEAQWNEWFKRPDWYVQAKDDYGRIHDMAKAADKETGSAIARELREFVAQALASDKVSLATSGDDLDVERKKVDTIVIHHTSEKPGGYPLTYMNAVHLLNLYVPYYWNPTLEQEKHLKGTPIWSNHFDASGRQVFYAYHWFVHMDGTVERLLADNQIGWQAGNWDINTRSVAICLDNDYEDSAPTAEVLNAVAKLIRDHYSHVALDRIFGHSEVNPKSICPGNLFLNGWKDDLVNRIRQK